MTTGPSVPEDVTSATVLRDISDTALWVAIDRARETERRHPLFRDPYARLLAGERGQQIARALHRGRQSWPVVVRWLLWLVWAFSSPRQRESYRNVSRYVLLGRR